MGFKNSDSNIEVLGEMITKTGGQVDLVDPAQVIKNFQSIFADDTIARDVFVRFYFPRGIDLPKGSLQADEWKVQDIAGNHTIQSLDTKGNEADRIGDRDECKILSKQLGSINSDSNLLVQFDAQPLA